MGNGAKGVNRMQEAIFDNYEVNSLFLQVEGVFDGQEFVAEGFVYLEALFYLRAAVDDGGVVATAYELADARSRHLGVFLCEIHGYLSGNDVFALTAAAGHG